MASISERYRANGRKVYVVQIIRRKLGNYRDSQTFENRAEAEKWAKKREIEIDLAVAEGRDPRQPQPGKETLGDAIDRYVSEQTRIGKTKAQCLRSIRNEYAICEKSCDLINSAHIVEFAKEVARRPNVNSPATVGNYLSHLSAIFNYAPALWGFPLDKAEMNKAIIACKHIGLTGKSASRERRPTLIELNRLLTHFVDFSKRDRRVLPMHIIIGFALFSTRRQDEIARIRWADYDEDGSRILVRKMKNPGMAGGVDTWCDLPLPAQRILSIMPKSNDRIFPYNTDVISRRFTDACKLLEIEDLHFHDLRHEGTTRLAEMGKTIPQIASVTGHKSWQSLQRYTHLRVAGDRYEGWNWLEKLSKPGSLNGDFT